MAEALATVPNAAAAGDAPLRRVPSGTIGRPMAWNDARSHVLTNNPRATVPNERSRREGVEGCQMLVSRGDIFFLSVDCPPVAAVPGADRVNASPIRTLARRSVAAGADLWSATVTASEGSGLYNHPTQTAVRGCLPPPRYRRNPVRATTLS